MQTVQDPEKVEQVGRYTGMVTEANKQYIDYWKENTLYNWDFWVSLFLFVVPILLWVKFRKKESSNRLLFVGFFVIIITSYIDFLGVVNGMWYYTGKVVPSIPSYVPWDFAVLPIFIMTVIQVKPSISPFLKGLFFAGFSAFVGEPIFIFLGFYVMVDWHIYYSFPIYFVIYLLAHKLSTVGHFEPITK